jgi:hypothetical protein
MLIKRTGKHLAPQLPPDRLMRIAIAIACAAVAGSAPAGAALSAAQEGVIVVPSGPLWVPASPVTTIRRFVCIDRRIAYRLEYQAADGGHGRRVVMRRLTVDGRRVRRSAVAGINAALAQYSSPPEVTALCARGHVRLYFLQHGGPAIRSEYYDIEP